MYSNELLYCPGCRNACPKDQLTCMIGEKFFAQQKAKEQAEAQKREDAAREAKAEE